MHPGARILLAILSALALPGLSFFYLAILSLALLAISFADLARLLRLLQRSRWLLLGLALVYAWQLPGAPLIEGLAYSPSREGVTAGLTQALRLAAMLLLIDLLILRLQADALLAGIASLLWPWRALGLPAERIALRLGLTLHALGNPAPNRRRPLVDADVDAEATARSLPDRLTLSMPAWRPADGLILSLAVLALGVLWLAA